MIRRSVIAVIGGGRETDTAVANARVIGRLIAGNGWVLITGGRDAGVMRAANEGAKEIEDSLTIGILPDRETEVSPDVDVPIFTDVGEARNNIIVLSADIVVACGVDDPGTASEVALALKAEKPVVLVGACEAASEFFGEIGREKIHIAGSPSEAIQFVRELLGS